jgi:hypothetical protein
MLSPYPAGVVTLILPVIAPARTLALIRVADETVKLVAAAPPKLTALASVKFVPVIVTTVPTGPLVGVKPVTVGAGTTVKVPLLSPYPAGVVTLILPVTAPAGTVSVIWVGELRVKGLPSVPPKLTAVAPLKFVPVTVTTVPTGPLVGVKPVIVGAETRVKLPLLSPYPAGVVTLILPLTAPAGTVAVI